VYTSKRLASNRGTRQTNARLVCDAKRKKLYSLKGDQKRWRQARNKTIRLIRELVPRCDVQRGEVDSTDHRRGGEREGEEKETKETLPKYVRETHRALLTEVKQKPSWDGGVYPYK